MRAGEGYESAGEPVALPLYESVEQARAAIDAERMLLGAAERPLMAPSVETAAADDEATMRLYVADLEATKRLQSWRMALHLARAQVALGEIEGDACARAALSELMEWVADRVRHPHARPRRIDWAAVADALAVVDEVGGVVDGLGSLDDMATLDLGAVPRGGVDTPVFPV